METRVKCNDCGRDKCVSYESVNVSKNCRMFVALPDFKTPLLIHLMEGKKAINTTKVLEKFGFKIEEIGTYPYFKLYTKGN